MVNKNVRYVNNYVLLYLYQLVSVRVLPKLVQVGIVLKTGLIQPVFELISVDFEVFTELVKALVIVS